MDYTKFKKKFQNFPLILSKGMPVSGKDYQNTLNQLGRWQKKKLIIKLKRGVYLLNPDDRKITPSRYFIANQLYSPSYVSLESALNFYGLIPEQVFDLTSVTTKKTASFKNELGLFTYQHIKPEAFTGYKALKEEAGISAFIAEPEKALVDFLYFNLKRFKADAKDSFRLSYRFQNTKTLRPKKILEFAKVFRNAKLNTTAQSFCNFMKEEAL